MSFSSEVKTELAKHLGKSRHCQIAELAALIAFEGRIPAAESENRLLMQKYQLLLAELFQEGVHKRGVSGGRIDQRSQQILPF